MRLRGCRFDLHTARNFPTNRITLTNEMTTASRPDPPHSPLSSENRLLVISLLIRDFRHSVAEILRNSIRVLSGRKPRVNDRRPFLWPIFLHLTGIRSLEKITCRPSGYEGPGSQMLSLANAINFTRCAGLTYVHTPFSEIAHADRPTEEWAEAWETLFNLGAGELVSDNGIPNVVSHGHHETVLALCLGWELRADEIHRSFNAMVPELRRKYYLNKSPRQNRKFTVAVHVRRGWDVGSASASHRLKSAKSILRTITGVKNVLDSRGIPHSIGVYSEGGRADFEDLCFPEIQVSKFRVGRRARGRTDDVSDLSLANGESVVDLDAIQAMQDLIEADVLIVAPSSFSYCAALISDGIKISAVTGDRPWIDGWLVRSEDGSFDLAAFERQLAQLTQTIPVSK